MTELWKAPPSFSYTISQKEVSYNYDKCYLSSDETELLLSFIVAEGRLVQHIFLSLRREDGFMLLKPAKNYPVLRSGGIKLLLAILAANIERRGLKIVSSSVGKYMKDGRFYEKQIFEK